MFPCPSARPARKILAPLTLLLLLLPLIALSACSNFIASAGPNPLVTQYTVNAPAGSSVVVEFGTDTSYGKQTSSFPAPTGGGDLSIIVAGMRPSTLYHMRARITNSDGTVTLDPDRTFTTGFVDSSRFPGFIATGNTSAGRGVEFINIIPGLGVLPGKRVQAIVTDLSGNLIWYYDHPSFEGSVFPLKFMSNGNVLVTLSDAASTSLLREVDLAWNTKREINLFQLRAALANFGYKHVIKFLHHDMLALPNGHFILLAAEDRQVGPDPSDVIEGDTLIDLDPEFKPVWVWSAFDHLDTNRRPLDPFDWTHGNSLLYTADHNILFSMRNQHWIVKIDYNDGAGTGNVLWRLGYEGDFLLQNGDSSDWFYGQHNPSIISTSGTKTTISVFDDGNKRVTAAGLCGDSIPCYSRAVIYQIDESTRTATQTWAYRPDLFTPWGGSTQPLHTGNLEFALSAPIGLPGSRAIEVSTDSTPTVVWEMNVSIPSAYRINRIPSLYPGVVW